MNKKFTTTLLIVIVIIATFLRLYNITQVPPGLYPDEAMNGNNALEALSKLPSLSGFKVFYPENNGREGLFINIQAISVGLFGNEPWALRVVSAIFGILTVLGVYFLTKELFNSQKSILGTSDVPNIDDNTRTSDVQKLKFGEKIALLSAFLIAVSFWHINFSRIGFRAIMAPFFLTWAIYFLLKSLNSMLRTSDVPNIDVNFRTSDVQKLNLLNYKSILYPVLGGLFFGLGFYSYIAYRAMPALILIILIIYWFKIKRETDAEPYAKLTRKRFLLIACLFSLAALIVFAPLGIYFLQNPGSFFGRTTQVSIFNSPTPIEDLGKNVLKTAGMFNFVGDWNWRHNYAGRPELFWPVGTLFLIGIFLGIKSIFTTLDVQKFASWILFSWLFFAALPVVVSNEGLPHALRSIIMIPPVFILAGFGGIWLYENVFTKLQDNMKLQKIFLATCCLILAAIIFEAYYTYFILWSKNPNTLDAFSIDYAWAGKGLDDLPKTLPKYVIVEAQGVDVRGLPMPTQTVMFLTDTFTPEKQVAKNIHYVLPQDVSKIPTGAYIVYIK